MGCIAAKGNNAQSEALIQKHEALRHAQYQNIEALIQNEALSTVNRRGGLYSLAADVEEGHVNANDMATIAPAFDRMLNTVDDLIHRSKSRLFDDSSTTLANIKRAAECGSHVSSIFVKYVLLDIVSFQLLYGMSEEDAKAIILENRDDPMTADLVRLLERMVVHMQNVNKRIKATLKKGFTEAIGYQMLLLDYLETKILDMEMCHPDGQQTTSQTLLTKIAVHDPKNLHALIEEKFEVALALHRAGLSKGHRFLSLLEGMEQHRLGAKPMILVDCGTKSDTQNADQAMLRANLDNLRHRLKSGETSAVGGSAYPRKRLPRVILDSIADSEKLLQLLVFEGTAAHAQDFARQMMATTKEKSSGVLPACAIQELVGLDGSGLRNVMTFPDGRQCLVMRAMGASRQCHIGAGIQLYRHSETNALVPHDQIIFASGGTDYVTEFQGMIERIAQKDDEDQGSRPELVNACLIVQNPKDLASVFGDDIVDPNTLQPDQSLQGTKWLYMTHIKAGGKLVRTFIPKVGGSGLYGVLSGFFVTAFFKAIVSGTKSPHILFNGTAGGFANTKGNLGDGVLGLGDIKPGGILIPTKSITEWGEDKVTTPMRTIVPPDSDGDEPGTALLAEMGAAAWATETWLADIRNLLNLTHKHAAVMAPALETYAFINEMVAAGHASVDVEGAATNKAVNEAATSGLEPRATFTPIYTHSDDPRSSADDFYDSLAAMGPLFEGSKPLTALLNVVKFMFEKSIKSF
jgi:hypothetical protein